MMLLSSLRNGGRRRASLLLLLLLLAAVLLGVVPVSASPPAGSKCPRRIECAQERRHFCRPGSSHCGPCLSLLEENEEGLCVERKKHHQRGKITFNPDLDEEIDFLHSVIEKQEVTEIKPHKQQSKQPAAVTSQKDAAKGKTDATKHRQENQDRLSDETERATTAAVHPTVSALPDTPTSQPRASRVGDRAGPLVVPTSKKDGIVVILMSLFVVVGTLAMILATVCFIKLQKKSRLAQKVDYPAFGKGGAPAATASGNGVTMGDKTLAQSAQMFHYQHQKQQMLSLGSHKPEQKVLDGEATSEEEEVGGDFTVYECPGLAPTGEMEVKNPLFDDSALHYQGNHK